MDAPRDYLTRRERRLVRETALEHGDVRCAEIKDPVSLAQRYPAELPASRYIPGRDL